jgi:hypothetical protein
MSTPTENLPTTYDAQMAAEAAQMAGSIRAASSNTISTKGKIFTMPNGQSAQGPLDVIILDYTNFNSYFKGAYNANAIAPPACYAIGKIIDDMKPGANAAEPQHTNCLECPRNQWKSAPNGGKGKACKNTVRLAVIPVNASKDDRPMTLSVSPTSLESFDIHIKKVAREFNAPPIRVITKISFDPNVAYPKLVFSDPVLHGNMEVAMALRPIGTEMLNKEPEAQHG